MPYNITKEIEVLLLYRWINWSVVLALGVSLQGCNVLKVGQPDEEKPGRGKSNSDSKKDEKAEPTFEGDGKEKVKIVDRVILPSPAPTPEPVPVIEIAAEWFDSGVAKIKLKSDEYLGHVKLAWGNGSDCSDLEGTRTVKVSTVELQVQIRHATAPLRVCLLLDDREAANLQIAKMEPDPWWPQVSEEPFIRYGKLCAALIEPIPEMNCLDGKIIPVTANGQPPIEYTYNMKCDNPAILGQPYGQCIPYSRIQRIPSSDPDVVTILNCRRYTLRTKDDPMFDDVAIIQYRRGTGDTCFFQSPLEGSMDSQKIPSPNKPEGGSYWLGPFSTAQRNCVKCHSSDPFVYSQYLGSLWADLGFKSSDPNGPYKVLGEAFSSWDSHMIKTPNIDNHCTTCHRMATGPNCERFSNYYTGQGVPRGGGIAENYLFPGGHQMPIGHSLSKSDWIRIYGKSVSATQDCCYGTAADPSSCAYEKITDHFGTEY